MVAAAEYWSEPCLPRLYDIVWTRFPLSEIKYRPGPKPRPGLVLGAFRMAGDDVRHSLLIAPGTKNLKVDKRPLDFMVSNYVEMTAAGLPMATRFDLDDLLPLPYNKSFFAIFDKRRHSNPIMGSLSPQSAIALNELFALRRALRERITNGD